MPVSRALPVHAAGALALAALLLAGCETTVFDVEEFGAIRYALDLTGIPAEDSDGFRIRWQHLEHDAISGEESFNVIDPPEFNPRTLEQVPVGDVRVSLVLLPRNCSSEDGEKDVAVELDEETPVTFTVGCD